MIYDSVLELIVNNWTWLFFIYF